MNGGKGGPVKAGGNAYLQREFPKLGYIIHARVAAAGDNARRR